MLADCESQTGYLQWLDEFHDFPGRAAPGGERRRRLNDHRTSYLRVCETRPPLQIVQRHHPASLPVNDLTPLRERKEAQPSKRANSGSNHL